MTVPRPRAGLVILAVTLFAAVAVGATGGVLISRARRAALDASADRSALLLGQRARLLSDELFRLGGEMTRLSQLAEVDLADGNMEPEKRVLRIARRDSLLFAVSITIVDARGVPVWSEPQGASARAVGQPEVEVAQGRRRPVLVAIPGEVDLVAPVAGSGAIVGTVSAERGHDLFGEGLRRAVQGGGEVALLQRTENPPGAGAVPGPAELPLFSRGEAVAGLRLGSDGQGWRSDPGGRRFLVTEAGVDGTPFTLRLVQSAGVLEAEARRPVRTLETIVGGALVLALAGGALLAYAVRRLERAELEVQRSRELSAMGKTAAAIAHEVKNSLNGLSVALDLLASGRAPAPAARTVHAQARSEIDRLRSVAEDLTLFAAPPRLEPAPVDVDALCRLAAANVAELARECQVEVALRLEAAVEVPGDGHKLMAVLSNLLRNGIEAMGPGAWGEPLGTRPAPRQRTLTLATARAGDEVRIVVDDTGAGIPAEVRGRVFEPFVTTKRTGTGLGLAISRRVVEAHGGTIEAQDRAGGGTRIAVRLPGAAPLRAASARPAGGDGSASEAP
ncbi:sensor histidine kinase [Anaeromyxobacter paludicola]|uniref:histidine kinase n=1 Tax=Anaeromyxobacter paludicola TaxID=2918171 RepID=A0ABM7XAN5_9BACT|nr:HAMP domain-containing sensor histidine kinase [Anaeromyxobacter paludicola]BDG08915.1 hypothetical protein AMPC_20280 [Anaeromyxobacter paludicola]